MEDETFGLLCIGNELLSGKVADANLSFWISELKELGRRVCLAMIIPDTRRAIVDGLRFARERADILMVSGGIGPTHDDVSLAAIAEALGRGCVRHPELERAIRGHYGEAVNEHLLSMADVPAGTELLFWDELTVPLFKVEDVYCFPGDPGLMRKKFRPLKRRLSSVPLYLKKFYSRLDEGALAAHLAEVEARHPGVALGSYPRYNDAAIRVVVTVESRDPESYSAALTALDTPDFRAGVLREEEERFGGQADAPGGAAAVKDHRGV